MTKISIILSINNNSKNNKSFSRTFQGPASFSRTFKALNLHL